MSRARGIPTTPWSQSGSRWTASPLGLAVLVAGLWVFGTGEALLLASTLGNSPWTVLAEGVSRNSPLTVGAATLLVSAAVLLLWIPLRERPGLGTVLNAIVISVAIDVMLLALPEPDGVAVRLVMSVGGVLTLAAGGAVYLTANLGPGPRDGLMTGLHRRLGWSIALVRTGLEVSALVAGWLLGGTVGIGTALFAFGVGPALSAFLGLLRRVYPQAHSDRGSEASRTPSPAGSTQAAPARRPLGTSVDPSVGHAVSCDVSDTGEDIGGRDGEAGV